MAGQQYIHGTVAYEVQELETLTDHLTNIIRLDKLYLEVL